MKLLYICGEYPPAPYGGIGIFVKTLAENLIRLNIQCIVLGLYDQDKGYIVELSKGVEVRRVKKKKWLIGKIHPVIQLTLEKYQLSREVFRLERLEKPDLVESFDWTGPLLTKPRSPLIVRLHGSNSANSRYDGKKLSKFLFFWERRNLKFSDHIISVSKFMLHITQVTFKVRNLKTTVIYNFIDDKLFYSDRNISRNSKKIIFVGKFHERKGVNELFRILNSLLALDLKYFFEFIGSHTADQKGQLMSFLDPKLQSRVTFTGTLGHDELPKIYNSAALMIMPSRSEAFGLTAIEAMACGCIVAMANRATGPELILDGIDGILINTDDTEESAAKLHNYLSNNKKLDFMRIKAIEKSHFFAKDQIIPLNIAFYKSVLVTNEV